MKREFNFIRFFIISVLGTLAIGFVFNVFIFRTKSFSELTFKDFVPVLSVFIVFGIRDYQKFHHYKKLINKGVHLLKVGSIWGFDNLIISNHPDKSDQIIVRNDLLWIEKHNTQNTDDLLNCLISDFEIICKNRKFKAYLENKSVLFNLYSSDLKDEQLLQTDIRSYTRTGLS